MNTTPKPTLPKALSVADLNRIDKIAYGSLSEDDLREAERTLRERHPDLGPILKYDMDHDEFRSRLPGGSRWLILYGDDVRRAVYDQGAAKLVAYNWLDGHWRTQKWTHRYARVWCARCHCVEQQGRISGQQDCSCRCHVSNDC